MFTDHNYILPVDAILIMRYVECVLKLRAIYLTA